MSGHKILHSVKGFRKSNLKLKHIIERIKAAKYNSAFAKMTEVVRFLPTEDSRDDKKNFFLNAYIVKCQISQYTAIFKYLKYICKEKQPRQKIKGKQVLFDCNNISFFFCRKKLLMQPYLCTKISIGQHETSKKILTKHQINCPF